ncbi:DUF1127 domain-containing protein [Endozoicomonas atrinae]|uniref:DUF1127 domain-containing protein n=1 Tax=Endozoicomonas atrinae TaxID=1333660 RepID=UPI003AFFFB76
MMKRNSTDCVKTGTCLTRLKNQYHLWLFRAEGQKNLAQMDTRMLKDIGLTEADRQQEISKPFWKG